MIKLFVNNQEVDIDQDETNVTVNYSIEAIDLGNIKGAHSKRNIKVPATKTNVEIFENIQEVGSVVTDAYKLFDARLEANGIPILVGKGRVDSGAINAINSGFQGKDFKLSLIGNNADWFADVGNTLVKDLGWDLLEVSSTEVKKYFDVTSDEYCYILMK